MFTVHMHLDPPPSCLVITGPMDASVLGDIIRLCGCDGLSVEDQDIRCGDVVLHWFSQHGTVTVRYEDNHAFDRGDKWMSELASLIEALRAA